MFKLVFDLTGVQIDATCVHEDDRDNLTILKHDSCPGIEILVLSGPDARYNRAIAKFKYPRDNGSLVVVSTDDRFGMIFETYIIFEIVQHFSVVKNERVRYLRYNTPRLIHT